MYTPIIQSNPITFQLNLLSGIGSECPYTSLILEIYLESCPGQKSQV